jgi:glutamate N-acetyltransferase/amino-acid N-acetyltransferase
MGAKVTFTVVWALHADGLTDVARHLMGSALGRVDSGLMSDMSHFLMPAGFRFGAVRAGLKASGRPDFALIVAEGPHGDGASAAAMFTANKVSAAPLAVDKAHLKATKGKVRIVAINAGNANCAAGQAGLDAAYATCRAAAVEFGCRPEEVFPSSTGIIGVPLPVEKLVAALPAVKAALGSESDHFQQVAQAILTTDLVEKTAFARLTIDGREVRIAAVGKGSGMIHPRLMSGNAALHATMLVYILTDAEVESAVLQGMLESAVEVSFNRISVDGDTSTNDTVLLLASGASGVTVEENNEAFQAALAQVSTSLARQIVADGEGVSHVVTLEIKGARNDADALIVAKSIAHSPLVKTAWTGSDPNWGRLMAAIGNSGADIDPDRIDIWFGELPICRNGGRAPEMDLAAAHAYLQQPEFSIAIDLHRGDGSCRFWTTDLTAEYVRINADYST